MFRCLVNFDAGSTPKDAWEAGTLIWGKLHYSMFIFSNYFSITVTVCGCQNNYFLEEVNVDYRISGLPAGTSWLVPAGYQLVPAGYQLVPAGYQLVPAGTSWYQLVPVSGYGLGIESLGPISALNFLDGPRIQQSRTGW